MKFSKEMLWTVLNIEIKNSIIQKNDVYFCFDLVKKFENQYSRFIEWNFLHTLNAKKHAKITPEFHTIIHLCLHMSQISKWYFDITMLPFLENAWYGISKKKLSQNFWYKNIILTENDITLKNNVSIEIGAVWKWYIIDKMYVYLSKKYTHFIINFWWDIRCCGKFIVHLENPDSPESSLWEITLINESIASSAWNKRQFNNAHHLFDPKTQACAQQKKAVFIKHKLSCFSDIYATAIFISPIDICRKILEKTSNINAYIIMQDGERHISKNFFQNPNE
jgi:thiamine biosynthesis lipoprotein ApbE